MAEPMLFDAEVMALTEVPPKRGEMFIVLACWCYPPESGGPMWTTPSTLRGPWTNLEAALRAADSLSSGWKHRRVVRIPGEG